MNILEILPTLGQPRGTSVFTWDCWGKTAQYVDWGGEENHIASAVFDRETGLVYCVELFTGQQALRYLEPVWADDFLEELAQKQIEEEQQYQPIEAETVFAVLATLQETPRDPT